MGIGSYSGNDGVVGEFLPYALQPAGLILARTFLKTVIVAVILVVIITAPLTIKLIPVTLMLPINYTLIQIVRVNLKVLTPKTIQAIWLNQQDPCYQMKE